jgi:hypothetical protein
MRADGEADDGKVTPQPEQGAPQLSRRTLLLSAGGGLAAAAGVAALYAGLARLAAPPQRVGPPPNGYPEGQYEVAAYGVRVVADPATAVQVTVPPLWNLVITATLTRRPSLHDQQRLEAALRAIESAYAYAPSGVFALVAYGLPYFTSYIRPELFAAHLPRMVDASQQPVLLDAIRFASDPATTLLERNDVVFHLRSDVLAHLHDIQRALFARSGTLAGQPAPAADIADLFHVTSVRTGFVGAGLPRRMAEQARLSVAAQIPETSPLFMGFTSTQTLGQAHEVAVRFDGKRDPALQPLTTARPGDYFAGGTSLHLSHLREDLDSWYALPYEQRLTRMFEPRVAARPDQVTVNTFWLNPNPSAVDATQARLVGHNEAVQRGSRAPEGQALQLRVDFNTLDDMEGTGPGPGVHFVAFTPGSPIFHASRQAMDATDLAAANALAPTAVGINAFIHATRRQNFLVPPRRHRAFPLLELQS